jgi:phosphonate transport system permease protein
MNARIAELRRTRPRNRFLRTSCGALAALGAWSWASGEIAIGELFSARRQANLERFLEREAVPRPLRDGEGGFGEFLDWAGGLWSGSGASATAVTLGIAVLAIVLAALAGAVAAPLGARTLMQPDPYLSNGGRGSIAWRLVSGGTRAACILLRAIPEYVWAFLLLAMLGPSAWPAVLALFIHNAGILGRLGADTVENLRIGPLAAQRALGASRRQLAFAGIFPAALGRYLLYFFYRFETCVREATVLGMLGVVSLGYYVQDARARMRYDEMLFLVALGALLVVAADVASNLARRALRRAGN